MSDAYSQLSQVYRRLRWRRAPEANIQSGPRLDFPGWDWRPTASRSTSTNSRNNTIDKIDLAGLRSAGRGCNCSKTAAPTAAARRRCFPAPAAWRWLEPISTSATLTTRPFERFRSPGGDRHHCRGHHKYCRHRRRQRRNAHFNLPTQLAADPNGSRIFLTDTNNDTIRMIQVPDMVVKTVAGQAQS